MKTVFVYGILQKDVSAKEFELEDKFYLGRATLYGYTRHSLTRINKAKRDDDYVVGDIFKVPDDIEEKLYKFEHGFGYNRETTKPQLIDNGKVVECISYILPPYD